MTDKAIELLSQDEDGFFLMVEGSQVDWAGHVNDPIYMVTDFLAFDEAVETAIEFAESDGETLVLIFPDHNTGALAIGNYYQDDNEVNTGYTSTTIEDAVGPLWNMRISSGGLVRMLDGLHSRPEIKSVFKEYWGIDVTSKDIAMMDLTDSYDISQYVSEKFTVIGWTTHGHSGEDVPLWTYSPMGYERPVGTFDNTEIAVMVANALGIDLIELAGNLFVDMDTMGYTWELDETNPGNPVLVIHLDGSTAELPISKDQLVYGGITTDLEGIVVYAPITGSVYVPQEALDILP
jgi:alkaline phosphatase